MFIEKLWGCCPATLFKEKARQEDMCMYEKHPGSKPKEIFRKKFVKNRLARMSEKK